AVVSNQSFVVGEATLYWMYHTVFPLAFRESKAGPGARNSVGALVASALSLRASANPLSSDAALSVGIPLALAMAALMSSHLSAVDDIKAGIFIVGPSFGPPARTSMGMLVRRSIRSAANSAPTGPTRHDL